MLKHLANVDELVESHSANKDIIGKKFDLKTKKENKEKDKLINPKQIFEKTPKGTKGKGTYRASTVDSKKPRQAIKEYEL